MHAVHILGVVHILHAVHILYAVPIWHAVHIILYAARTLYAENMFRVCIILLLSITIPHTCVIGKIGF